MQGTKLASCVISGINAELKMVTFHAEIHLSIAHIDYPPTILPHHAAPFVFGIRVDPW